MHSEIVQPKASQRNPRIGLDTYMFRVHLKDAPSTLMRPDPLTDFKSDGLAESIVKRTGEVLYHWTAKHPRLGIQVRAHKLRQDPVSLAVSGNLDVSLELSRIKDALERPHARHLINQGVCSSDEAGRIVCDIVDLLQKAFSLGQLDVEVLRMDVFCDFYSLNTSAVISACAKAKPQVKKTKAKKTTAYEDPDFPTGVVHPRRAGQRRAKMKGREETRLYLRKAKILEDLSARRGLSQEEREEVKGSIDPNLLRYEVVHGREQSGGCAPLEITADFSVRRIYASELEIDDEDPDDEDPEDEESRTSAPTLSLAESLDPRIWAGLILARLKEQNLYSDAPDLKIGPSRLDLLRRLKDAGIHGGYAAMFAEIAEIGPRACKEELEYPVPRILKVVQEKSGITLASLRASDGVAAPFQDIVNAALRLARGSGCNPKSWIPGILKDSLYSPKLPTLEGPKYVLRKEPGSPGETDCETSPQFFELSLELDPDSPHSPLGEAPRDGDAPSLLPSEQSEGVRSFPRGEIGAKLTILPQGDDVVKKFHNDALLNTSATAPETSETPMGKPPKSNKREQKKPPDPIDLVLETFCNWSDS